MLSEAAELRSSLASEQHRCESLLAMNAERCSEQRRCESLLAGSLENAEQSRAVAAQALHIAQIREVEALDNVDKARKYETAEFLTMLNAERDHFAEKWALEAKEQGASQAKIEQCNSEVKEAAAKCEKEKAWRF